MPPAATETLWPSYVGLVLLAVAIAVLVGLLLNVNKMLARLTSIRREIQEARENGPARHLEEAVTHLQSAAVSLDRIAARCDDLDRKAATLLERGPGAAPDMGDAVRSLRDGLASIESPITQIRDALSRTESERLSDEVRRALFTRGYDKVTIQTDVTALARAGEHRVLVEVLKEGVRSKGFVLLRDGNAVDVKISSIHEMFP